MHQPKTRPQSWPSHAVARDLLSEALKQFGLDYYREFVVLPVPAADALLMFRGGAYADALQLPGAGGICPDQWAIYERYETTRANRKALPRPDARTALLIPQNPSRSMPEENYAQALWTAMKQAHVEQGMMLIEYLNWLPLNYAEILGLAECPDGRGFVLANGFAAWRVRPGRPKWLRDRNTGRLIRWMD